MYNISTLIDIRPKHVRKDIFKDDAKQVTFSSFVIEIQTHNDNSSKQKRIPVILIETIQ